MTYLSIPSNTGRVGALSLLALVAASSAQAGIITQDVNFNVSGASQLYFNKFNPSLGTLTGVTLAWTVNSSISTASITNLNAGTVSVSKTTFNNTFDAFVPSIGEAGLQVIEDSKAKSVNPSPNPTVLTSGGKYTVNNVNFNQFTQTDNLTGSFDSYKGTGNVGLYLTNTFGATPTVSGAGSTVAWETSITGNSVGNLGVTYTYDEAPVAPVPEPSALLLCGAPALLGGISLVRRMKKGRKTLV